VANKMPFQAQTAFGASGSSFGSTVQVTCPGSGTSSGTVYLATSSQTILSGMLPTWAYVWLSSTGATYVAFQVNADGAGTTWTTWQALTTSAQLLYLDGTAGQRCVNPNTTPVAVYITPIKQ
jgi:hypothetical protein